MKLIEDVRGYVHITMNGYGAGHGLDHIERVVRNAKLINEEVKANQIVVEISALLHDIGDAKFHGGDDKSAEISEQVLQKFNAEADIISQVVHVVESISYRKGKHKEELSKEAQVVQDADRLDALGAIGLVRCVEYGYSKGRDFYNPAIEPKLEMTPQEYSAHEGTSYNHIFEKLLTLSSKMNTDTGRRLALSREIFLRSFVSQYHQEWIGKC